MYYVAVSRLKTQEGLHLRNFKKQQICACPAVMQEYERLRTQAPLQMQLPVLQTAPHKLIVTAFNARSLHANIANIRNDTNLLQSNVLFILETWANQTDSDSLYSLPDFAMDRSDNSSESFDARPHRGIIAYSKQCSLVVCNTVKHSAADIMSTTITTPYYALNVVAAYRSPQLPMHAFLKLLDRSMRKLPNNYPTVIIGDFNVDIKGMTSMTALNLALQHEQHHLKALVQFMMEKGLAQMLTAATADSGMQIDHIWTDLVPRLSHMQPEPFVLESYFSDHRPIGLQLTAPS